VINPRQDPNPRWRMLRAIQFFKQEFRESPSPCLAQRFFSDNDGQARIPSSFQPIRWVKVSKPGFKTSAMIDVESGGNGLKPCQCVRASDSSADLSTPASLRRITVDVRRSPLPASHRIRLKTFCPRLVVPQRPMPTNDDI
jgi:hypothetical protein